MVPRALRDQWRTEWLAELAAHADALAGQPPPRRDASLRYALGAPLDAFWIRQRSVADLTWVDDLRHGWRQLRQQTGFAVTAVGILALGMAASVTAFSVVSQVLLRPLPYPEPDRVVTVWQRQSDSPAARLEVAPGNFLDWRARARSFRYLAAADPYSYDYTGGDRPEVLRSANVTEGFFEAFGMRPLLGRFFLPDEHRKGANHVVVLSARLWRSHFGADPGIVGRAIPLDHTSYTVVGVVSDDFQPHLLEEVPGQIAMWAAKAIEEHEPRSRERSGYWQVVGRLADGRTLESAQAEMDAVAAQIARENPRTNTGSGVAIVSLRDHLVGDVRPAVMLFAGAVLAVLLIACVNVTNLLLARGASRRQELAIRSALGANRARLVGQLLVESLMLASLSSVIAVAIASGAMRVLASFGPREVLWIDTLHVDGAALAFAVGLTIVVAAAAGLVPSLRLSGSGLQAPGDRTMTGDRSQRRLRSVLVAAEVALALMLVSGCALLLRSFVNLLNVDAGFRSAGVVALQVFAWDRHPDLAARRTFFERVTSEIGGLPGVEAVGAVMAMPFIESNIDISGVFGVVGRPAPAPGDEPRTSFNVATPGYFAVMQIPLRRGRHLDARDGPDAPRVTVISEALAAAYWPDANPLGSRLTFRIGARPTEVEIVGVVGSTRHVRLDEPPRMELFLPHAQSPSGSMTLVARTTLAPALLIEPAKAAVWTVDPLQTFYRTATLDALVERTLTTRRFALIVLTGFAALALILAAAGLYGVLSAIVSQYRREIGVRVALGAEWLDIVRLVVRRGLVVAAFGVAMGLASVLGASRVLRSFLFGVAPTDPVALGGAAALMMLVTVAACYLPARRAAQADPAEALRVE